MLSIVLVLALSAAADEQSCSGHLSAYDAELEMLAAQEYEAGVYAAAEVDFAQRLEELGLAGSTLGREEARASAGAWRAVAGN